MNYLKAACLVFCIVLFALFFQLTKLQPDAAGQTGQGKQEQAGRVFASPSGKPQRIVSMSPSNTEILFALGAGDRVVGVTAFSDYPEEAKAKPSIGGYHAPDLEKIISLAPDVVFAAGEIQANQVRILEQAGIRVVVLEPRTLQEVLAAIDTAGEVIGEPERGAALHAELANQLDAVRARTAQAQPKRVFLQVWDAPLLTVGKKSFMDDMVHQAGGINVAGDKNVDYTPCDIESLYAYNPEVYVVISHSQADARSFAARQELADITAIKDKQVFQLADDVMARPGPRCFAGLVQLAEILHPSVLQERRKE